MSINNDWHTHVCTSTYTSDVSGVCSVMYELGGLTLLHDPSGCNSTYTTHDEPRWYDSASLMFISGLDEMSAVLGDDSKIIEDACLAIHDLKPKFVTLCGASIPHIIGFDYKGVAKLIEERCGVPVIPVTTDGLRSYISGIGKATRSWIQRFAKEDVNKKNEINLLGITPIDFGSIDIFHSLKKNYENIGETINCSFALEESFESLTNILQAMINCVPSSAGRIPAKYMYSKYKIPYVEGLPVGPYMSQRIQECINLSKNTNMNQIAYEESEEGDVLVIGEEIYAKSMATEINHGNTIHQAFYMFPDDSEGLNEDDLIEAIQRSSIIICDPLFKNLIDDNKKVISIPHIGYSGRIYIKDMTNYLSDEFDINKKLEGK